MSIEDILRQAAQIDRDSHPPPLQAALGSETPQNYAGPGGRARDGDLTSSLLKRVTVLERSLDAYKREVKEKYKENIELKDRLEGLQKSASSEGTLEVYSENKRLKQELEDIKSFLKDYGLVWKGSKSASEGEFQKSMVDKVLDAKKPRYNFNLPKEIDISLIHKRVNELNFLIQKEGNHKEVKKNPLSGAHEMMDVKPKPIVFYKNGVHLEGFPIFYYGSHEALAIMADILDGYYPRQLQKSYPDGILMEVIDRLDEVHGEKTKNDGRQGSKTPLTIGEMADEAMRPVPLGAFLNGLPEKAIKDGKIIEVRKDMQQFVGGGGGSSSGIGLRGVIKNERGDWVVQNKFVLEKEYQEVKESGIDITVLKIRVEALNASLILYIDKVATIDQVFSEALKCVTDKKKNYKLENGFPRAPFDLKDKKSLEELGLHPRAALYLST